jgi:pimeloyl-ACP methyl ester carboxylesterase
MPWKRTLILGLAIVTSAAAVAAKTPGSLLTPESSLPMKKTVPVFGQRIAYYDTGSGPVVVLVHGFASEARFDWGNVIVPLAKRHRVIALDQIGFGASEKPLIDYSIQTYVDFLGEFLRVLKVNQFTLVGESLGGWISALYTIEALDPANQGAFTLPRPGKLVLEDAAGMAPLGPAPIPVHVTATIAEAKGVAIVFHDKSRVTDEFVRESFAMKLKANDGSTQRLLFGNPKLSGEVVSGRLSGITIPTLVIWGGADEIVPLEQGRGYAAGIAGAKLTIVPECGHAPSIEKPEEFLAAVLPFIDRPAL